MTTIEIISKAKKIQGNNYDYSKLIFENYQEKFIVICPKHGEFKKDYSHFILREQGCPKCAKEKKLNDKILIEEFKNCDFKEKYKKIIEKAKSENRKRGDKYYEKHHINPKSLGGNDEEDNLVLLTPEEHFKAHYLLWKFSNTEEMQSALWLMVIMSNKGKEKLTPEEYGRLRKQASEKSKQGKPVYCLELDRVFKTSSEATIFVTGSKKHSSYVGTVCNKKISACFEWKNGLRYHWCWAEEKEEFKKQKEELMFQEENRRAFIGEKISKAKKGVPVEKRKGKHHSEEAKKKMSLSKKGKQSSFKGKHHSEVAKKKISLSKRGKRSSFKGKHHSEEAKKKIRENRSEKIMCVETGVIYASLKEALLNLNVKNKTNGYILKKAALNNKKSYGFTWQLIED